MTAFAIATRMFVPACFAILAAIAGICPAAANAAAASGATLSVMTYNVHGLPWPAARGRHKAFREIERQLTDLRAQGTQPHVVVLQEAFTPKAKLIGARSGYRFVVDGPARTDRNAAVPTEGERAFEKAGSLFKGEKGTRLLDSGLQILSDYPVLSVKRLSFPAFACAGYDCLANKGALLVTIAVPGSATPVTIATTHLNACIVSGVALPRTLIAYQRQVDALTQFIAANRDPRLPLIVAGDFNVSSNPRLAYLLNAGAARWVGSSDAPVESAVHTCLLDSQPCGNAVPPIASYIRDHGRDWQFFAGGRQVSVNAVNLAVPFGPDGEGKMLSDHIGYEILYRLQGT
jgi:endonuclease/exonuclease/phosphatase family metal-dependent hydrolase